MNRKAEKACADRRYAFIEKDGQIISLSIGRDVPGLVSHGAATEVGKFSSIDEAKQFAVSRGVLPERIYT